MNIFIYFYIIDKEKTEQIFLLYEEKELYYFLPFKPIITMDKTEVTETPLRSQIIGIDKIKEISKFYINNSTFIDNKNDNVKSIEMIKNEIPKYSRFSFSKNNNLLFRLETIETCHFIYKKDKCNKINIIL